MRTRARHWLLRRLLGVSQYTSYELMLVPILVSKELLRDSDAAPFTAKLIARTASESAERAVLRRFSVPDEA